MDSSLEENQLPETAKIPETVEEHPVSEELSSQNEEQKGLGDLVKAQAAQYQYIEGLEDNIFSDGVVDENEVQNVNFCKAQVLLQLVSVETFASHLGAKDPRRKAVDVLLTHLYKCYGKTERLREKVVAGKFQSDYEKNVAEAKFGYGRFGYDRYRSFRDDMLIPQDKHINLILPMMGFAGLSFLKDFLNNPEDRIKAQIPELIKEFMTKASSKEKDDSNLWAEGLVDLLSKMKGVKAMKNALEGGNILATVKQLGGSKGI